MTTTVATTSPVATGGKPATGRNIYIEGNRYVGRFQVVLTGTWVAASPVAWDPAAQGFPYLPAEVKFEKHLTIANIALARYNAVYDYVNKEIQLFDTTDGDTADGDTVTGVTFDVVVYSE